MSATSRTLGKVGEVSTGASLVMTEDDLVEWVACAAACTCIQLRNPPFLDVDAGAELLSIAMESPPVTRSVQKDSWGLLSLDG